ncbi:MAG: restriction endonuclease [Roseiarcus sp.]|jgi:restriction system protein
MKESTIWGIHMEWDDATVPQDKKDIAIGWHDLGDLNALPASRDAFKAAFATTYVAEKAGAVPVKAGVLFRFAKEMTVGDVIVYPSKADRLVNIGLVEGNYTYSPTPDPQYPHRRRVGWKVHAPRAQFSQPALYEIGSAITLFQIANNAEEFLAALHGKPFKAADVDAVSAVEIAVQAEEGVEDFVIKQLKNGMSAELFEKFIAELLRCMGYFARVTRFAGDGGVDIIAHKDELGFEPPIIKVQCKQTLSTIGGPAVQQLLGAIQPGEHALFITLGDYTSDAVRIERGKSNLRLIGGADLVKLVLNNYERFEPRFKTLLPLKRSYTPNTISTDTLQS